ncbi:MAG: PAS domain-containing protein [Actinomycetota bacterium]|nr:PAS domain-containing protein [Actinomycetota bacterium]
MLSVVGIRRLLHALGYALATCDASGSVRDADGTWAPTVGPVHDDVTRLHPGLRPDAGDGYPARTDSSGWLDLATGDALDGVATMILPFHTGDDARVVEFVLVPTDSPDGSYLVGAREAIGRAADDLTRRYLASFLGSTDVAVVGARADRTVLHVNAAAARMFDVDPVQVIGSDEIELFEPARRGEVEQALATVAGGGRVEGVELLGRTPSGRVVELAVSIAPVRGRSGAVVGHISLLRDLASQREADRLAILYATVSESSPVGLSLWSHDPTDGSLALVATNAVAREISGLTSSSVGRTSAELAETCGALSLLAWPGGAGSPGPASSLGVHDLVGPGGVVRSVELVTYLVAHDVLALRMTDVTDEVRARRDRVHLLRRVAYAEDAERRRLAEALHDDTIQLLAAANMELGVLRRRVEDDSFARRVERVEHRVRQATRSLRSLVFELYPPDLVAHGLVAALPALAQRVFEDTGTETTIVDALVRPVGAEVRTTAYRIVQEALVNARRHACAAHVTVALAHEGETLVATIADDGVGIASDALADAPGHLGLRTMRERAESLHGSLAVRDASPRGVEIEVRLPDPELALEDEPSPGST